MITQFIFHGCMKFLQRTVPSCRFEDFLGRARISRENGATP